MEFLVMFMFIMAIAMNFISLGILISIARARKDLFL